MRLLKEIALLFLAAGLLFLSVSHAPAEHPGQGPDRLKEARRLAAQSAELNEAGRHREALPLAARSLFICEEMLGSEHLEVALSLNNLAEIYRTLGRYKKAEPLYLRSRNIFVNALGPDHPRTATSFNNVASCLNAQGRYGEAEPLYRKALEINERVLGHDHPSTRTTRSNLRECLARKTSQ